MPKRQSRLRAAVAKSIYAANPQTTPRIGNIVAGNGTNTVAFSIGEAGQCLYYLSTLYLELGPGGGSATVNVTTGAGCVWSAVPNETWLSITAGASGTGSGSFTLLAAPPSTQNSFSGTITVMGQTLSVVVGSSVGTPGTGTVTISGSPRSYTFNACPGSPYPHYCPVTIQEGGNVSVTVADVTFTVGYAYTAAVMASSLATTINNSTASPVTATVSNGTITLTSKLLGTATDYPVSTSYSFGPTQYFSSPAFVATASGPTLTGGTD